MDKQHFNYGAWTRGRFSEAVTVTGPGKMIFLAGIGAEHEETGEIQHMGDFTAQCRYAFSKLVKVLERNGASLKDVVKQVTYVTDARFLPAYGKCRAEAYGDNPLPAHTMVQSA
jgi:enamine deaminase RidA (YjgF/YER057c/UK114 family)